MLVPYRGCWRVGDFTKPEFFRLSLILGKASCGVCGQLLATAINLLQVMVCPCYLDPRVQCGHCLAGQLVAKFHLLTATTVSRVLRERGSYLSW